MKPIDRLEAVLLDPDGEVCTHGSDVDRRIIKESLEELRAEVEWLNIQQLSEGRPMRDKYFFDEEAEIIDTIIDELEMHPSKKEQGFKQQYVFSSSNETRAKIRAILNKVYQQGKGG